jgi:hypothetical protein
VIVVLLVTAAVWGLMANRALQPRRVPLAVHENLVSALVDG